MSKTDEFIKGFEKQFGKGAIFNLASNASLDIESIPTGVDEVDEILGIGGLPKGRIVEIFGAESSGKTTLCLTACAGAQRAMPDRDVAIIDFEHALDRKYTEILGVDLKRMYVCQPDTGQQGLNIADELIKSGLFSIVVIDSIAAITTQAELDGEVGDANVGQLPRMVSQFVRKTTASLNRTGTILICTNQIREKIGVMFGSPLTTPGGRALKHGCSVRIKMSMIQTIKSQDDKVASKIRVETVKNKCATPAKQCEVIIRFGEGIDRIHSVIQQALEQKILDKKGGWFSYNEKNIANGADNMRLLLKEDTGLLQEIELKLNTQ